MVEALEKAARTSRRVLGKSGFNNSERTISDPAAQLPKQPQPYCPECGSNHTWHDGILKTDDGDVQRYLCCECGLRFSDINKRPNHASGRSSSKILCSTNNRAQACQVCATSREAKNLATVINKKTTNGLTREATSNIKGKIVEFAWYLKKQGSVQGTIQTRMSHLRVLSNKGANLIDPESVKGVLAQETSWSDGHKHQMVWTYDKFTKFLGITWTKPRYRQQQKIPFIPLEKEIDDLIAGCGHKTGTMLLMLKETAFRIGEVLGLKWTDVDFERNILTLNQPEKGGYTRQCKLSSTLIARLNLLQRKSPLIFGVKWKNSIGINYKRQCRRLAEKVQNPRLLRITFHTFRHWKATMEYQRTKDILYVKQLLGHKNINNTLIYTQLVSFEKDDYHVRTAKTLKEACELAEAGFEYFTSIEDTQVFRKRK